MLVRQGRGPFTTVVYPHADEQAALSDISQTALVFPERFGAFPGCPGLFLGSHPASHPGLLRGFAEAPLEHAEVGPGSRSVPGPLPRDGSARPLVRPSCKRETPERCGRPRWTQMDMAAAVRGVDPWHLSGGGKTESPADDHRQDDRSDGAAEAPAPGGYPPSSGPAFQA